MKYLSIIFLTICLFINSSKAQITIGMNDMPIAGDTFRYSVAPLDTATLFGYQNSGANQLWRFDSLVSLRQGVNSYYASNNTPYSSQVTNRIGQKIADTLALGGVELYDVYDFFNRTSNGFIKDYRAASVPTGLSWPFPPTLALTPSFTDPDEIFQFPLNYLDRDSSTFDFAYSNSLLGAYYGSNGYRINEVDAWGTLITPYDTFTTIRVITDVVSYDTVSFGGNSFGINSHTRNYTWLSNQKRNPVMTVSGNVVMGQFIPTNVQYIDSVRNVPPIFAPIALFNADTTDIIQNDTIFFNNLSLSITPPSYRWSISGTNYTYVNGTSPTSQNPIVVFSDTGLYSVELIVQNNQGIDTLNRIDYIRVFANTTGLVSSIKNQAEIMVYPNPMKSGSPLFVKLNDGFKLNRFVIYSLDGKEIVNKRINLHSENLLIPTQSLRKGSYMIILYNDEKQIVNQKFIVQ